jgi:hypothetical protein
VAHQVARANQHWRIRFPKSRDSRPKSPPAQLFTLSAIATTKTLSTEQKICARCGKPVSVNSNEYDLFERMHWLCFHLEFEHQGDPDAPCSDASCPWWHIEVFRRQLADLGHDPDKIIERAIRERFKP